MTYKYSDLNLTIDYFDILYSDKDYLEENVLIIMSSNIILQLMLILILVVGRSNLMIGLIILIIIKFIISIILIILLKIKNVKCDFGILFYISLIIPICFYKIKKAFIITLIIYKYKEIIENRDIITSKMIPSYTECKKIFKIFKYFNEKIYTFLNYKYNLTKIINTIYNDSKFKNKIILKFNEEYYNELSIKDKFKIIFFLRCNYIDCAKLTNIVDNYINLMNKLIDDETSLNISNKDLMNKISIEFLETCIKVVNDFEVENKTKTTNTKEQYNERVNEELTKISLVLANIKNEL